MPYTDTQKRQHIFELQRYLHSIASREKSIPLIIPDGVYGNETMEAVREFQRSRGIPETGETDPATWDAVVKVYKAINRQKPQSYSYFPSADHVCERGSSGLLVWVIQAMLKELSGSCDNLRDLSVCGTFDDETAEAVADFRRICGLSEGSHVDCETWDMLVSCCSHIK